MLREVLPTPLNILSLVIMLATEQLPNGKQQEACDG